MAKLTLVTALHGDNAAIPSVHDAFSQRGNVVDQLVIALSAEGHLAGLLKHLGDNRKVVLESTMNGVRDITKRLEDSWLELITKCSASEVVEKRVHESVTVWLDVLA